MVHGHFLPDYHRFCIIGDLSYWNDEDKPFSEVIGLRVKCSDEERKIALSYASSILGDLYNYSFLFNTVDKSYCSDLISKAYKTESGITLSLPTINTISL